MNLKIKIFSGFVILSLMLLTAGIISIREFLHIGHSVQNMLDENYKSINAANNMIEALEREDSGILFILMGHRDDGIKTLNSGDSLFTAAYHTVHNNITIENEDKLVAAIDSCYTVFQSKYQILIKENNSKKNISWYYEHLHFNFLNVKNAVNKLMTLNQSTLYMSASGLKSQAYRSVLPGIVAIIASFVFALLFSFFVHLYVIKPILKITRGIEDYNKTQRPYHVDVETHDEIKELNLSIKKLMEKLR